MAKRRSPENTRLRHQIKSLRAYIRDLEAFIRSKVPLRPAVFSFAMTMEQAMRDNDEEKGDSWTEMEEKDLIDLFFRESTLAYEEVGLMGEKAKPERWVHVANYAMMLYHRTRKEEE